MIFKREVEGLPQESQRPLRNGVMLFIKGEQHNSGYGANSRILGIALLLPIGNSTWSSHGRHSVGSKEQVLVRDP